MPWIQFVISSYDAPSVNYENEETKEINVPKSAEEELAAIRSLL